MPAGPPPTTSRPAAGGGDSARTAVRRAAPRTKLYNEAKKKNILGRSKMSKAELEKAVGR